jgi:hypothetical protein
MIMFRMAHPLKARSNRDKSLVPHDERAANERASCHI